MANGKKRKNKWLWIGLPVVLIVIVGTLVAVAKGNGAKIDPSKLSEPIKRGDIAKSVVATGKIEPITKVEIKSKASGIVKKIYADYGQTVKAGQVLVELDRDEIQAQVNQARAQLQSTEASAGANVADVERAKYDAEGVDIPTLQHAYERAKQMAQDGVVSQAQLDDAQRAYVSAVNKRDSARANIAVLQAKAKQGQADVAKARATLAQLEEQLSYTTITAPIDGVILSRDVEVGDAVSSILVMGSSATLVMTIGDMHEVYVLGKVDESDIAKVYLGEPARIKVESFKDKTFSGKVTKISPMGVEKDNVTTFEVRASIDNHENVLKAEMTANAEIILDEHKNVITIPEGAIIYDKDKKASVQVADDKAKEGFRKVPIEIGISNGSKTEVLAGLQEGQRVILQQ